MKAVILAGGYGTRISEESHLKPKPMIEIGGKPILWHIMKIYSFYGINEFIICARYIVSNDGIVTNHWLEQLLLVMQSDENIGIVVPACNFSASQQQITVTYKNLEEMQQFAKDYNHSDKRKWLERIRLTIYMGLFRTEVLQRFGGYNPVYSPCYFEDDDLSYRYRRAGYKLIFTADTFVHHYGSVTVKEETMEIMFRNHKKFQENFGVSSWEATELEHNLIQYYDYPCSHAPKLLGIGDSCGATLLFLKNEYQEKKGLYGSIDYGFMEKSYQIDLNTICENVYDCKDWKRWKNDNQYDMVYVEPILDTKQLKEVLSVFYENVISGGDLILCTTKRIGEYDVKLEAFKVRFEIYIRDGYASVCTKSSER